MQLSIQRIKINNFKNLEDITIYPNSSFNIIIGENNAGKSTIFEAIHLWEKCYKTLIANKGKSFYQGDSFNRYISYQALDFLRITVDKDLFTQNILTAEITITLNLDGNEYPLGVKINKPKTLKDAFFRVSQINGQPFKDFAKAVAAHGRRLDDLIFIYQTRPVAGILQKEPYYNEAQIRKKVLLGQSHEVLRNKIIKQRAKKDELQTTLTNILQYDVVFELPPAGRRDKDEYIKLMVESRGKKLDLHLQGSGFLQVAEIVSSIEYIDAPLKLLLVDEPDSHIHTKLQGNLLKSLRKIENNQFFVISHNDQFVNSAQEGEVFFLNDENKEAGELRPVPKESFDVIKKAMGGVILALDQLNDCERIVLVEGDDDTEYVHMMMQAYHRAEGTEYNPNKNVFVQMRGKDNIKTKVDYNKRTLASLFRGKKFAVIFDADYCTNQIDAELKENLKRKTGNNGFAFSHSGYCFEATLFSDLNILSDYICSLTQQDHEQVLPIVTKYFQTMDRSLRDVSSELTISIQRRFEGQKPNRPEINDLDFAEYLRDVLESQKFCKIMAKPLIAQFIAYIEVHFGNIITQEEDNSDEFKSYQLLSKYFEFVQRPEQLVSSFATLARSLEGIDADAPVAAVAE